MDAEASQLVQDVLLDLPNFLVPLEGDDERTSKLVLGVITGCAVAYTKVRVVGTSHQRGFSIRYLVDPEDEALLLHLR